MLDVSPDFVLEVVFGQHNRIYLCNYFNGLDTNTNTHTHTELGKYSLDKPFFSFEIYFFVCLTTFSFFLSLLMMGKYIYFRVFYLFFSIFPVGRVAAALPSFPSFPCALASSRLATERVENSKQLKNCKDSRPLDPIPTESCSPRRTLNRVTI